MPREQINYPQPKTAMCDSPDGMGGHLETRTNPALHVCWMPDMHVQVAFEADPSYLHVALGAVNEPDGRTSMYTDVLTRTEINRLIKMLRRARDAAYGRDE